MTRTAKLVLRNFIGAELSSVPIPAEDVELKQHERQEEVECALHSLLEGIGWALAIGDSIKVEDRDG